MEQSAPNEVCILVLFVKDYIEILNILARRENQGKKMKQYLAEERLGSDGEVTKKFRAPGEKRPRRAGAVDKTRAPKRVRLETEVEHDSGGSHDSDFVMESSDSESSGSDDEIELLTNAEVCAIFSMQMTFLIVYLESSAR